MARKNNKTNHVLNLLAGGGETEAPKEEAAAGRSAAGEAAETAPGGVQVIDSQSEDDEIAGAVNRLLEEELEETGEPEEAMEPEAAILEEPGEAKEPEPEAGPKEEVQTEAEEDAALELELEAELKAGFELQAEKEEAMAFGPEAEPEEEETKSEKADDYVFVSVMERLVRDRVGAYMAQFSNCNCSRCTADTVAITLGHLPAKYVVVSRDAETPLLNFYSQHYAGQITVEIMKACTQVNLHPHHGRD